MGVDSSTNDKLIDEIVMRRKKIWWIITIILSLGILIPNIWVVFYSYNKNVWLIFSISLLLMVAALMYKMFVLEIFKYQIFREKAVKYDKKKTIKNIKIIMKKKGYNDADIKERQLYLKRQPRYKVTQVYIKLLETK